LFKMMGFAPQGKGKWAPAAMRPAMRPAAPEPAFKRARIDPAGGGAETAIGEVRFVDAMATQKALQMTGSVLGGYAITVEPDARSKDGTKVTVRNLPDGLDWHKLKDHFGQCGFVKYADVKTANGTPVSGVVRFATTELAQSAMELNGTVLEGHEIAFKVHPGSKDQTKLQVFNIPSHMDWQELKDFFNKNGLTPIYCDVTTSGSMTAEVRFEDAQAAQAAAHALNGSILGGGEIQVVLDTTSTDGCKLAVSNVPAGLEWQELKDHFGQCGTVAFVQTSAEKASKGKGKGGKGKGKGSGEAGALQAMQQQMSQMMAQLQMMQKGAKGGGFSPMAGGGFSPMASFSPMAGGAGFGAGMFGGGKGAGTMMGEVRFSNAQGAQTAVMTLNGSSFKGATLSLGIDQSSQDASKIWVAGVPAGASWQELKEHFSWAGAVVYCNCK